MADMLLTVKVRKGNGEVVTINATDLDEWIRKGYNLVPDTSDSKAKG